MGALACGSIDTYPQDIERLRETLPTLAMEIASFTGIGHVIDWFSQTEKGTPAIDLIGMDELEYEFVVEARAQGCWLVFGVT
jgi:hypothetical protein